MWDATRLVSGSWNSSKDAKDCFCCSRSELHEEELRACHHYPLQIRAERLLCRCPCLSCSLLSLHRFLILHSVLSWFSLQSWAFSCHLSSPWIRVGSGPWLWITPGYLLCLTGAVPTTSWDRTSAPTWKMEVPAKWGATVLLLSKPCCWSQW